MPADAGQRDGGEGGGVRGVHEAFDEQLDRQTIHWTSGNCRRHCMLVGVELLDLRAECIHRRRWSGVVCTVSHWEKQREGHRQMPNRTFSFTSLCSSDIPLQLTVYPTALVDLHRIMRIEAEE